jgi:hypothetical protein|tara:strand:- start:20709 stop:21233 length:525 start_codon:yes stop_codon:yes gene_type:complete
MSKDKLVATRITERQYNALIDAADNAGVKRSDFVRNAISMALSRGGEHRFMEISITPRAGSSLNSVLEWLCSRQPMISDLISAGGTMDSDVRRVLYQEVSKVQARRLEKVLRGMKLEVIGHEEGCSRQAVHASVKRAIRDLKTNKKFITALCGALPESGLTPDVIIEAIDHVER